MSRTGRPKIDLLGQRFGRLVVVSQAESKGNSRHWFCRCDCGNEKPISGSNLRLGKSVSCGCYGAEIRAMPRTHGKTNTAVWRAFRNMRQRCENPKCVEYPNYGGRGIKICDRWKSFENFYADMGDPPSGMTIDRKNNSGNYEPSNCRWVTQKEQSRNTRRTRLYEINGATKSLTDWCDEYGVHYETVRSRLKQGRPIVESLSKGRMK